jgi:hypothetical protein
MAQGTGASLDLSNGRAVWEQRTESGRIIMLLELATRQARPLDPAMEADGVNHHSPASMPIS